MKSTELNYQTTYTIVNSPKNLVIEVSTSIGSTNGWSCAKTKTFQHATSVLDVCNKESGALIPHAAVRITTTAIGIEVTVLGKSRWLCADLER